jgi:hypothetical protein
MLRDDVSALRAQLEDDVTASFARAVAELIGQAEGEARRIREVGATLLDVAPTPPGPFEGRTEPSRFSLAHAEVPTVFESLVPERARWLPWAIARRRLEARVRGDADRLLDMYLGRIRSDEVRRIRAEVSRLAADLRAFVGASADALERAFDRARRAPLEGEGTTRDLRAALLDAEERLFRLDQETWEILCDAEWMGWTE